jgi:type IV secretory pathway VirB10-like protein
MAETPPAGQAPGTAPVMDYRPTPRGVLPRRGQVWLMVGIASGLMGIILLTGRQTPAPSRAAAPSAAALMPNPEQLRGYQQRLAAADTRPQPVPPTAAELRAVMAPTGALAADQREPSARPVDQLAEERQRREYDSLFASNVVQSPTLPSGLERRTTRARATAASDLAAPPPSLDDVAAAVMRQSARYAEPTAAPTPPPAPATTSASAAAPPPETTAADGPLHRILEGTLIDTVLTNRLDGTVAAPVNCLVSTPLYSADGQEVLIPAGARILGTTKPVQSFGETRLAVAFSRLVLPNGRTYTLDHFLGLNAIGDAGLRDQVNQHYTTTFGVSAAVGLISGFAQFLGGGFGNRTNGTVIITGNVGDATAQAAGQTMGRLLNRLPNITIREGHRVKVYLTSDLQLPVYQASPSMRDRGMQLAGRVQP